LPERRQIQNRQVTPDGQPDPSVFSTEFNREGFRSDRCDPYGSPQSREGTDSVRFRHIWGKTKRADLLASADNDGVSLYDEIHPSLDLGLPFYELTVGADYLAWPLLTEILPTSFPGVQSKRDEIVVDIDRETLLSGFRLILILRLQRGDAADLSEGAREHAAI